MGTGHHREEQAPQPKGETPAQGWQLRCSCLRTEEAERETAPWPTRDVGIIPFSEQLLGQMTYCRYLSTTPVHSWLCPKVTEFSFGGNKVQLPNRLTGAMRALHWV